MINYLLLFKDHITEDELLNVPLNDDESDDDGQNIFINKQSRTALITKTESGGIRAINIGSLIQDENNMINWYGKKCVLIKN